MQDFKSILYIIIGNKIKSLRTERNLSQEVLSKHLNLSRSSISNIELGRHQIPLFLLYELSQLLNIDINELIPSWDEIQLSLNSDNSNLSKMLNDQNLNENQKTLLENILKGI